MKVIIIGAGFGGLCMGIRLKEAGIPFEILEKAPGVGGTWWYNRYPGCACDIPSMLYSFSFEPKTDWSCSYPDQPELLEYLEHCARKHGLYPHIRFNTEVTAAEWNSATSMWVVSLANREVLHANILVGAVGGLHVPSYPNIPGRESFRGPSFHSSLWDQSFDYKGQRLAVIGSAASAIQIVPEVAKTAAAVYCFQRTPNWISPKEAFKFPIAVKWLFQLFPRLQMLYRWFLYWRQELLYCLYFTSNRNSKMAAFGKELLIRWIKETVKNPQLHEHLIPKYAMGCKRLLIHNEFYSALNERHVHLVVSPIQQVTENGIQCTDTHHEVDAIVWATGFEVMSGMGNIRGSDGTSVDEIFKFSPHMYHGISLPKFPNLFVLLGPNTGLGHNSVVWMIECQVNYTMKCLEYMLSHNKATIETKESAMNRYMERLQKEMDKSIWKTGGCTSWYKRENGDVFATYPGYSFQYWWDILAPRIQDFTFTANSAPGQHRRRPSD